MTTAGELAPHVRDRVRTTVRYELHGNVAVDLSEQLLTSHPPTSSRRFVCYPLPGTGRFADLGRTIELEVFGDVFGNDRAELEGEYGPYEEASRFFVVMDQRRRRAAGVLRVIENSPVGLKTLRDIAGGPLRIPQAEVLARHGIGDLDRCWDVGTLAVRPEYRRSSRGGGWRTEAQGASCDARRATVKVRWCPVGNAECRGPSDADNALIRRQRRKTKEIKKKALVVIRGRPRC